MMATDPMCGMTVKESEAAGEAVRAGERYYFCTVFYSVVRRSGKSRGGRQ
jgi:YHS domain-containing protein